MVLTKIELVKALMQSQNYISKDNATRLVESFFEEICHALEQGEEVKLPGIGNFNILHKKARPGRNPKTGDPVVIKARRVVSYLPSNKLKVKVSKQAKPKRKK